MNTTLESGHERALTGEKISRIKTLIAELSNLYEEKLEELDNISKETEGDNDPEEELIDDDYRAPKAVAEEGYLSNVKNPYLSEVAHLDNKWHARAEELFKLLGDLSAEYGQSPDLQRHLHPSFIIYAEQLRSRYQDLSKIKSSIQSQKTFLEELSRLSEHYTS